MRAVTRRAVAEVTLEPATLDPARERQETSDDHAGIPARWRHLGARPQERGGSVSTTPDVELAQVVEHHLRLRRAGELASHFAVCAEVAQDPVTDPALRHASKLLFGRQKRALEIGLSRQG